MPRGRPRKVIVPEQDFAKTATVFAKTYKEANLSAKVADIIHNYCGVPGCSGKWHIEEANKIIDLVRTEGFV